MKNHLLESQLKLLPFFISTLFILLLSPTLASASGVAWTDMSLIATTTTGLTWISITSSSDGTKLVAVEDGVSFGGGDIWTSIDSGVTWVDRSLIATTTKTQNWVSVTSSTNGTKLAAVVNGGDIWTSPDSGVTWTDRASAGSQNWVSVTSSADGVKLAAVVNGGDIWTSPDSGATWTDQATAGARSWRSITSSSDGVKLAAVVNGGDIWTSPDSGATWTDRSLVATTTAGLGWYSMTASSDGTKLAAVVRLRDIWTSADSGVTWVDETAAGSRQWSSITFSSDGTKLGAVVFNGDIWTSTDSGVTWVDQTLAGSRNWASITSSSAGSKLAAVAQLGDIFTATLATTPVISLVAAVALNTSAIVTWDTDVPSDSQVNYGTTASYGNSSTLDTTLVTTHIVPLSGLAACTTYHYNVTSNASGLLATSSDNTFITGGCAAPAPVPVIVVVVAPSVGGGGGIFAGPVSSFFGFVAPRPQIIFPDGHIVFLDTGVTVPPPAGTITQPIPPTIPTTPTLSSVITPALIQAVIAQNHRLGDSGASIQSLQVLLNALGFTVSTSGPGSPRNETTFFGNRTLQAVIKFQAAHNLPTTGFFGPLTRAVIATL